MTPFKISGFNILFLAIIHLVINRHIIYATESRDGLNEESSSRNYYPSNNRFRRGFGPREEPKYNKYSTGTSDYFGAPRKESSRSRKGSSRGGFSTRNSDSSRNIKNFGSSSNSFPKFGKQNRWPTVSSNPKGRSKGGSSSRKTGQSPFSSPKSFSRPYNFGGVNLSPTGSFGSSSGNSPHGFNNNGKGTNAFNSFGSGGRASNIPTSSYAGKRNNFFKAAGTSFDHKHNNRGKGVSVLEFPVEKNSQIRSFTDLTGGEIVGPLKNVDLKALLLQYEKSLTTKSPRRIVSKEDRNKIFSGNSDNVESSFESFRNRNRETVVQVASKRPSNCADPPNRPANGALDCTRTSNCIMNCNPNYQTRNGDKRLYLRCSNNKWTANGNKITAIPNCEPICDPPCKNGGICAQPFLCTCIGDWEGSLCDRPKQTMLEQCFGMPPSPTHTNVKCRREDCLTKCDEGYAFESGITEIYYVCQRGQWMMKGTVLDRDPECIPICDSPCLNDGICMSPNRCKCTEDFHGLQCQYPSSNCNPESLNFNGFHNCSMVGMKKQCQLRCPDGIEFTYPPAEYYTCNYATSRWTPFQIPECDYSNLHKISIPSHDIIEKYIMRPEPKPGICFTWSGLHYKSFDGKVYSFESDCPYTLLQDSVLGTFSVNLVPDENCRGIKCGRHLKIFTEGDEYILQNSGNDQPILTYGDTTLVIPGQMNGLISERVAHFVVLKMLGIGLTVKWDMKNLFITEVSEYLWNRTSGLCGRLDGSIENDWGYADGTIERNFNSFLKHWQANTVHEVCTNSPKILLRCSKNDMISASRFCARLQTDPRFDACRKIVDVNPFVETCQWDYCNCKGDPDTCSCESYSAFFRECINRGGAVKNGWRSEDRCAMKCSHQLVYKSCMPAIQSRCGQAGETTKPEFCVEGCDCISGLVLDDKGNCIKPSNCPCIYQNRTYSAGDTIPNNCNSCACVAGEWVCTKVKCGSRCSSVGDPHYTSFDGKRFDFMGQCSYYLVKGSDFSIEAENVPCAGAISQKLSFPVSLSSTFPSCTKSLTIRIPGTTINFKQGQHVTINGVEITKFSIWANEIFVKRASSLFLTAYLPNGIEVWWDGQTRVYIDIPAHMRGKVGGLCGTFTDSQKDDFLSPEGDVELNPVAFANKWKTSEKCVDMSYHKDVQNPCERHVQNKKVAEKYCSNLMGDIFSSCHLVVDPEPFYLNCMYDVCSCETNVKKCMCPILASYGEECAQKRVFLHWRNKIRECGIQCTGDQVYQICGDSCAHTCLDIASNPDCKRKCVEGCNCEEGFSLNLKEECVPISSCPCVREGKEYKPGYEMLFNEEQSFKFCKCVRGSWKCRTPTQFELESPEFFSEFQLDCSKYDNETYTDCMPEEEINCLTMHLSPEKQTDDLCQPGCRCSVGFVRDRDTKMCIKPSTCPCHHGGKSYTEGDTIVDQCNTCTCEDSFWSCTKEECPAICTAWGSSHYKTFDGRIFDFQGMCDYMLAKGRRSISDHFEISVQNVPCGTNGVTCAKALTLRVGTGDNQEVIRFSRNKPIDKGRNLIRTVIREAGIFVIAEVADMGLQLQWDRGTRAYITLSPSWQGQRVRGLCGNYNDNSQDDLQTPSGGIEVSAKIFGDSWRLQKYCPESITIKDTCALHPERKTWAIEKCSILKSETFSRCHFEVDVNPYFDRCLFDSCGCDTGGDCECLCTAIGAYAQECNIQGVSVRWRSAEICPMQCDETCEHYEPCVSTCAIETCDSYKEPYSTLCVQDPCVEGCAKKPCDRGTIRKNSTDLRCVPVQECDNICLVIEGDVFMEGDIVTEDDCHTCYCSKNKNICKGTPCESTIFKLETKPTRVTTPFVSHIEETEICRSGWSAWLNQDHPLHFKKTTDIESIPEFIQKTNYSTSFCDRSMFVDIICRTVGDHEAVNDRISCNLIEGLRCIGSHAEQCKDYEISLLCDCSSDMTTVIPTIEPIVPVTPPSIIAFPTNLAPIEETIKPSCENEGWSPWFNHHFPNELGEFETLENIRRTEAICPDHYIVNFECRPVAGRHIDTVTSCSSQGALCRNNGNLRYCKDYEFRIFCQCQCQDGLGMEDGTIPTHDIIMSSSKTNTVGRFNSKLSWIPDLNRGDKLSDSWIQIDLQKKKQVTGIITQGLPTYPAYIKSFAIQVSDTGTEWKEIRNRNQNYVKTFRSTSNNAVKNIFPEPVFVRFLRIVLLEAETFPAFRFELLGCDLIDEKSYSIIPSTTALPDIFSSQSIYTCEDGWTTWMNSHKPSPGDWNDIENYESLRMKYSFCEEAAILNVDCRESVTRTPLESTYQNSVVCNRNIGLQCNSNLQTDNCYDYEIRFYCDCSHLTSKPTIESPESSSPSSIRVEQECIPDSITPTRPHEWDCQKFYECQVTVEGGKKVLKTCGPGTLYNPASLVCEMSTTVYAIRPECKKDSILISASSTESSIDYTDVRTAIPSTSPRMYSDESCPVGRYYEEQAILCSRVCIYYRHHLMLQGRCLENYEKAPACVDEKTREMCPRGYFLRNNFTCVSMSDCNCILPNGMSAPPERTFLVSDCELCKCSQNKLTCDKSRCFGKPMEFNCNEWSPWMSVSAPTGEGDIESLDILRRYHPDVCLEPSSIECRLKNTHEPHYTSNQKVICNTRTGLICLNKNNPDSCKDYETRIICSCDEVAPERIIFPSTIEPQKPKLTLPPPLPGCKTPYWTEWFNVTHPYKKGGDYELIDVIARQGFSICPKDYITEIQCAYYKKIRRSYRSRGKGKARYAYSYQLADHAESDDMFVTCSKLFGLTCVNSLQAKSKKCNDYSIRVLCDCHATDIYEEKEKEPFPDENPPYPGWPIVGQKCDSSKRKKECAIPCKKTCSFYKHYLHLYGNCYNDADCTAACLEPHQISPCPEDQFMSDNSTCVEIQECNCRLRSGIPLPGGMTMQISRCEQCSCENNVLSCFKDSNCIESRPEVSSPVSTSDDIRKLYSGPTTMISEITTARVEKIPTSLFEEITHISGFDTVTDSIIDKTMSPSIEMITKPRIDQVTTVMVDKTVHFEKFEIKTQPPHWGEKQTVPSVTIAPPSSQIILRCNEWSPWLNMNPTSEGDFQLFEDLRARFDFCEHPTNISCRGAKEEISYAELHQSVTCSIEQGFICLNKDNRLDCYDYEVSLYCQCDDSDILKTFTPVPEMSITDQKIPCDAWSPWINEHKPWFKNGDSEYKSLLQLQHDFNFCTEGEIRDIECKEASSNLDVTVNKDVMCDKRFGLKCRNEDQNRGICFDFKIRYYCSCDSAVTTRPTMIAPRTTISTTICDPEHYIDLLNNVPDSAFSATSSAGSEYSPAKAARLNKKDSKEIHVGGAWIPKSNENQYLQIDLGEIQTVYGFYLAGSSSMPTVRVKSFTAISSDDYLIWSPMSSKTLQGSLSNTEKRLVLLPEPVEARWIRLLPKTWSRQIAIRVEIIGCSVLTPSEATSTIEYQNCKDGMGLENGKLLDSQITVSSVHRDLKKFYGKHRIRLNSTVSQIGVNDGWVAEPLSNQFVKFNFLGLRKLTGIITQGSVLMDAFVESYSIMYSADEQIWNEILDSRTGEKKIFSANYDSSTAVENIFDRIIEAQYLKLIPEEWHNAIAMRIEIKGCYQSYPKAKSEPVPTPKTFKAPPPFCNYCPGLPEELYMKCHHCSPSQLFNGKECVYPLSCPCFYENRIYKRGSVFENADCQECTCEAEGKVYCKQLKCSKCNEKDERSVITPRCQCICKPCPENTKLCVSSGLCLNTDKWCDGIENCPDDELNCLPLPPGRSEHPELPGIPGFRGVPGPRGVPELSPVSGSSPKPLLECPLPKCPEEWKLILNEGGDGTHCPTYICSPPIEIDSMNCPQPLCPFSFDIILVPKKMDESCPKYECKAPSTTSKPYTCPSPTCPDGYNILISPLDDYQGCPQYNCSSKPNPTAPCPPSSCPLGYDVSYTNIRDILSLCPAYTCNPIITTTVCPPIECPRGLQTMFIRSESHEFCPPFTCVKITRPPMLITPLPIVPSCPELTIPLCGISAEIYQVNPNERCPIFKCRNIGKSITTTMLPIRSTKSVCKIVGRRYRTFDGLEFTLEPCEHILARDKIFNNWQISNLRVCTNKDNCTLSLNITTKSNSLILNPDFNTIWDGYDYTIEQMAIIGERKNQFSISKVGDSILFTSKDDQIKIVFDRQSNIQIELSNDLMYQVDGLCGLFSGSPVDDRTKINGKLSSTLREFENSWRIEGGQCTDVVGKCTMEESKRSYLLCNSLNSKSFAECHDAVPIANFLKGCMDRMCVCLKENNTEDMCKCSVLSSYVTSCIEKKPHVEISDWRVISKCYKECPHGEQYNDCFRSSCEKSCSSLKKSEVCTDHKEGICVSGCFCEPGLLRKGSSCVPPDQCRDSTCQVFGASHFISFDGRNFTMSGSCTFIAARDMDTSDKHKFQILATAEKCQATETEVCIKKLQILTADKHEVEMSVNKLNKISLSLDKIAMKMNHYDNKWIKIEAPGQDQVKLLLTDIQVEISYTVETFGLTIKVPSYLYSGKLEGLCGNLNSNPDDDFTTPQGQIADSLELFGNSWATPESRCEIIVRQNTSCLPPSSDPCLELFNETAFGNCHLLVDPTSYVHSCQLEMCVDNYIDQDAVCTSFAAYAQTCLEMGICLDYRNEDRCPKTCHKSFKYFPCGKSCVKTCDSYEQLNKYPSSCSVSLTNGCYCPDGTVLDNGICVNEGSCITCDAEGHRVGDVWKTAACTTCECKFDGGVTCLTKACPILPICLAGFNLEEVEGGTDECCGPNKECKLVKVANCSEPVDELCDFGKQSKLIDTPGLCPQYICTCIDRVDCQDPEITKIRELKAGEQWKLETTGCCDKYVITCTERCPQPNCSTYYEPVKIEPSALQCCPEYVCEKPRDSCIFEPRFKIIQGFERALLPKDNIELQLYGLGDKWFDGLCTESECLNGKNEETTIQYTKKNCQAAEGHPDEHDYELKEILKPNQCCPEIVRISCKIDELVITVNSSYQDPLNGCRSVDCKLNDNGNLEKVEQSFNCNKECALGWKYVPALLNSAKCCGQCQQISCEYEGILRSVGEKWKSKDLCTHFQCVDSDADSKIRTRSKDVICKEPTSEENRMYLFKEEKYDNECCSTFIREKCIFFDGQIMQVGEERKDQRKKCLKIVCELSADEIINRREVEQTCSESCPLGHKYMKSNKTSEECCGECLQIQCVYDNKVHQIGDTWENPHDKCYQYECQRKADGIIVVATKRFCPYFDIDCPEDKIVNTQCCKVCNVTSEKKRECQPEEIDPKETIGMFEEPRAKQCKNHEAVTGFKRCRGQCDSKTEFKSKEAEHVSVCSCCRPSKFSQIDVSLKCIIEGESISFKKSFTNIESCECQPCEAM